MVLSIGFRNKKIFMTNNYNQISKSLTLLLLIVLVSFSLILTTINAQQGESLHRIDLRQCFEKKRLQDAFSSPSLYSIPLSQYRQWCLRVFTDRRPENIQDLLLIDQSDRRSATSVASWVEFSWYRLQSIGPPGQQSICSSENSTNLCPPRPKVVRPTCTIAYDGFRGEYRLSPDFGGYPQCSPTLEKYFFELHKRLAVENFLSRRKSPLDSLSPPPPTTTNPYRHRYDAPANKRGCPIRRLPFALDDFKTCTLMADEWYALKFRSYVRWETRNGTVAEAVGRSSKHLLWTNYVQQNNYPKNQYPDQDQDRSTIGFGAAVYHISDALYLANSRVNACRLNTVLLLRRPLPFRLSLWAEVSVRDAKNSVKEIHRKDRHDIQMESIGKEFMYDLPKGTLTARVCLQTAGMIKIDSDDDNDSGDKDFEEFEAPIVLASDEDFTNTGDNSGRMRSCHVVEVLECPMPEIDQNLASSATLVWNTRWLLVLAGWTCMLLAFNDFNCCFK